MKVLIDGKMQFSRSVMDIRRISPRILSVVLVLFGKVVVSIITVYESQSVRSEKDEDRFYDNLSVEM